MQNEIFISIKPVYCKKIKERKKLNEFRNYKPKNQIKRFWIYESSPTSALKYIADVSLPIEYPNKVEELADGDDRFNNGENGKYAFYIERLFQLEIPIELKELKSDFSFTPPQGFAYTSTYPNLVDFVENKIRLNRVF
ncbi:Predicted transcriptional regulator, contains an HTH and PUA-like domains [Bacillus sp. 491mf]|uniref:hypothetical protein n=1 Tax=Bacillus sp. 491mf TaxID=1761755 RepID=UPI0008EE300B|nr:hypothetical protein [Bacillus sp. 491mf]SFC83918.1 Predicted transcriptional regulator, contains an HTH and PUA-like domains [Bacillus sp. 491mf]